MKLDNDKKKLNSEQKYGKYNIAKKVISICLGLTLIIIQAIIYFVCIKVRIIGCLVFILDLLTILHDITKAKLKENRILWIFLVLLFPILGAIMYFLIGNNSLCKYCENKKDNTNVKRKSNFLRYTLYKNEGIEFLKTGEDFFVSLKNDLKNAKKSIYIEMYILSDSKIFDEIKNILIERTNKGVKIEIIYDVFGSLLKFKKKYVKELNKAGIKIYKYNKLNLNLSKYFNYRNHKKLFIIDEEIAYTGGINISDEYLNEKEKYGIWKDCGIRVQGNISKEYLREFMKDKLYVLKEKNKQAKIKNMNISQYQSEQKNIECQGVNSLIIDGPFDEYNYIEDTIIDVLNNSKNYVYISTPYFIPNNNILNAINNAASRGIDVQILVPHICDKKIVEYANRQNYREIIESGAKIFEYKPGFIHSKYLICDDEISLVGTYNLDYKSIYYNSECMNFSYKTGIEDRIRKDFEGLKEESMYVTKELLQEQNIIIKLIQILVKFMNPIL